MRDHPTDAPRFGRRKISGMLKDWNALRAAVRGRDMEAAETALDRCEEWIDFAFGAARVIETPEIEHVAPDVSKEERDG